MSSFFTKFIHELDEQRLDDHRYYHQSKINQFFHLLTGILFLICYVLLFTNPILAMWAAWSGMIVRQFGHFFLEPKGFDHINQVTHEHKEKIKVGYNLFRKKILLSSAFILAPLLAFAYTLISHSGSFYHYYGVILLCITGVAVLFRVLYLAFSCDMHTAFIWLVKIITDPISDIKLYWKAPYEIIICGQLYEPGVTK